jgi:hypothetical protein
MIYRYLGHSEAICEEKSQGAAVREIAKTAKVRVGAPFIVITHVRRLVFHNRPKLCMMPIYFNGELVSNESELGTDFHNTKDRP